MTKKKVWRYKCDYCKKSNCSASSIKKHERGCTANPERVCGMCAAVGNEQASSLKIPILQISIEINDRSPDAILAWMRTLTGNCPACILSAIRQSKSTAYFENIFDFKEECELFWQEHPRKEVDRLPEIYEAIDELMK
jgi:hypothetical protein